MWFGVWTRFQAKKNLLKFIFVKAYNENCQYNEKTNEGFNHKIYIRKGIIIVNVQLDKLW